MPYRASEFHLRQVRRRAAARYEPGADGALDAHVARINELTQTARLSWLGLLSYLAFVEVTLLGVQDADFFIPERQTELPLLGVTIPTLLFFKLAPTLGAALFGYHHLHLLKMWEALTAAPEKIARRPLSDQINPWMVSDFALGNRPGRALRPRPLRRLTHRVSLALVFLAGPIILLQFWLGSMPAHDELMTVGFCGVPLLFSIYVGAHSWWRMRRLTDRKRRPKRWGLGRWSAIWLVASLAGWFATEGTLERYQQVWARYSAAFAGPNLLGLGWISDHSTRFLVSADLADQNFAKIPQNWLDRDVGEAAFRRAWCRIEGLPALVCYLPPKPQQEDRAFLRAQRLAWCAGFLRDSNADECFALFARFEDQQWEAWQQSRKADIEDLNTVDFYRADLRNADLSGARLEGAVLSEARLQGATLDGARLEAAQLLDARMQRASLFAAQLQGAQLLGAHLQRAFLYNARLVEADMTAAQLQSASLEGAHLNDAFFLAAQMQDAVLNRATVRGANFSYADLRGAYFDEIVIDAQTVFEGANLRFAAFRTLDILDGVLDQVQLNVAFADGTVTLPEGFERPTHWAPGTLGWQDFEDRWRAWQRENGYTPGSD